MKALTLVSAVMLLALTISVMALIYHMGMPVIDKMQKRAVFEKAKSQFAYIDQKIEEVASEGNHSRRVVNINLPLGRTGVDSTSNALIWEMLSTEPVIPPRTAEYSGNMIAGTNLNTSVHTGSYNGTPAYVLSNSHLTVYLRKLGSQKQTESCTTGDIFLAAYQKDLSEWLPIESINISIDSNPLSTSGQCYTSAERLGDNLPYGMVTLHMFSQYLNYTVRFTLGSGTDFLEVQGSL